MRKPYLPMHWLPDWRDSAVIKNPWVIKEGVLYTRRGVEVSAFVVQYPYEQGIQRRWFLIYRRLGEDQVFFQPVFSQSIITTTSASNQTGTTPSDWNPNNNWIETIGSGASGGAAGAGLSSSCTATGGGAGAWNRATNVNLATPNYTFFLNSGGAVVQRTTNGATNGNDGPDVFINGSTIGTSSCGSKGGTHGVAASQTGSAQNGGAGGVGSSGVGSASSNGGRGGNTDSTPALGASQATGGGGAGGPVGNGLAGNDITGTASAGSNGGEADACSSTAGNPGTGGTAASGTNGGNGSEWSANNGSGGGGGGGQGNGKSGGDGGQWGGGGGAVSQTGTIGTITSGAGKQGAILLNWFPVGSFLALGFAACEW